MAMLDLVRMRFRLVVTLGLFGLIFALAGSADAQRGLGRGAAPMEVDVALVLAVDISFSMDHEEQILQREGYVEALRSPEFMQALRKGMIGKVAVTYVEWGGVNDQAVIVPWRIVDGPETAEALAREIAEKPIRRVFRTSISGALRFSADLFAETPFLPLRRVIDISGDGPNNQGPLVQPIREAILAQGITINGLPIMIKRPTASTMDIVHLDIYFEDCVIGGPGSFVVPVTSRDMFRDAIRTKLLHEVADLAPPLASSRYRPNARGRACPALSGSSSGTTAGACRTATRAHRN